MIIFDLDGTLADCEHRRHFVDEKYSPPDCKECENTGIGFGGFCYCYHGHPVSIPDLESFYEACDQDSVIAPTAQILKYYLLHDEDVQIWSGRSESVRTKTENWLDAELDMWSYVNIEKYMDYKHILKMRPDGDFTPDEQLKERWLDELLDKGEKVDFVFDDRPKVIAMWRRRGIFVFDCNQLGKEF